MKENSIYELIYSLIEYFKYNQENKRKNSLDDNKFISYKYFNLSSSKNHENHETIIKRK